MKTLPLDLALLVRLLSIVAQVITFYLRFGVWNTEASFVDYLFFPGRYAGRIDLSPNSLGAFYVDWVVVGQAHFGG